MGRPAYTAYTAGMPAELSPAARELIESDALAHVVTLDPDGRPHLSLAWVGLEGDEVVFGTLNDQRKLRNLRRDPRITISIEGERTNEWGLREYLVLSGTAVVTDGGGAELLQRLAHTYLGSDVKFPAMPNPPTGYVTRVRVEGVSGIGPWR